MFSEEMIMKPRPVPFAGIYKESLPALRDMAGRSAQSTLILKPGANQGILLTDEDCTPEELKKAASEIPGDTLEIINTLHVSHPEKVPISWSISASTDTLREDRGLLLDLAQWFMKKFTGLRKQGYQAVVDEKRRLQNL
jgi:hypothetical protein